MKNKITSLIILLSFFVAGLAEASEKPWSHGDLRVSDNGLYLQHEDGTPFFWLADTGWLLPQRLDRDEARHYLEKTAADGFNVVQIQVLDGVSSFNRYGSISHPDGWNLDAASKAGEYGYWEHLDHIIDTAERNGIYIGMVCIWGGLVKAGLMDEAEARTYGEFLAKRYGNRRNIIWIIGGDIQGDIKTSVWDALARAIKANDPIHLMTFHPRGRTTSARWFNDREWLDFNMFQSGHRRYDQRMGNKDYPIPDGTEEDSWMYVDSVRKHLPVKPVLDGEPSYENIPQGLHEADEPLWNDKDVRRYAYWSVFGGSCGHTYGHNNVMQFIRPGLPGAYFADGVEKPWYLAIDDPGRKQMKYLKRLMLTFPYFERVADKSLIIDNGERYERILATRGGDYILAYNHTGRKMKMDLSKISGKEKNIWTMDPADGSLTYVGKTGDKVFRFTPEPGKDIVLIAVDATRSYLTPEMREVPEGRGSLPDAKDLTE
ncbi:MAG: glycoside hydrolase family 140 protein [Muribaculaceae bacterium]|nr:glycoside hydrolase family 140 protein [Muribaculaceae bacterium]